MTKETSSDQYADAILLALSILQIGACARNIDDLIGIVAKILACTDRHISRLWEK